MKFKEIIVNGSAWMFEKDLSSSGGGAIPIMIPFVESLPRAVKHTVGVEIRAMDEGEGESSNTIIVLVAKEDMKKNEFLTLQSIGKTNTDLLLNTGQFILGNPDHGIPFSIQLSTEDPHSDMKLKILKKLNLTETSEFMITTTGEPDSILLKMLRIQLLNFHNFDSYHRILNQNKPISLANELKVLRTLWITADSFSNKFTNNTLEYEIEILNSFQTLKEKGDEEPRPMTRIEVAAHLRLSEKRIIESLRMWIRNHWLGMVDMNQKDLSVLDEFNHLG